MSRRKGFRPEAVSPLEERVVLSHPGAKGHVHIQAAKAVPATFGALGDSLSDEYKFYAPDRSRARNWVEILAATKRTNFGPFSSARRGEPRNQGFAFNWARSDSTSSDMVNNQLPGLVQQVGAGKVRYVSIFTGDNDFGYFLRDAATGKFGTDPTVILARLAQVEATAEANFDTAVNTLLAAGPNVRVVANTVFDLAQEPAIRLAASALGPTGQQLLTAVSGAIGRYNGHIRAVAAGNDRVALADQALRAGTLGQSGPSAPFGDTTIDLTTVGDDYHHLILADGVHPGTVAQGIIANTILDAIDAEFGASIRDLSPTEILRIARGARRFP